MIRVAILGTGYWGINLVRCFYALPGCRLHVLCDIDAPRLASVARQYPPERTCTQIDAVLADPEVDAVVVALPVAQHYPVALAALRAGKHAFVEKPLARSYREASELVREAQARSRILLAGHTFEYNEAVRYTKRLIDSGELGDVYYVYGQRLNLGRVRSDVDALWNLAPHDVSILLHWLGDLPERVWATGHSHLQDAIADVAIMHLQFPGNRHAHVHVSWLDPGKVRRLTVVGSRKMVVYDDTSGDRKIEIYDKGIDRKELARELGAFGTFGEFQLIQRAGDVVIPKINFKEPLALECQHFLDSIASGTPPLTDGRNGARVVAVLEAASLSLHEDGRPILVSAVLDSASRGV